MSNDRARSLTYVLLQRWQTGDTDALGELLASELDWIRARVRRRLGPKLAALDDSEDLVHDAMVHVLEYGPRFTISSRDAFRGLMARLVENVIRDRNDYHRAEKRDVSRRRELLRETLLDLDPPQRGVTRPSVVAQRAEDVAWVRLGIELLEPEDREVLLLRHWHEHSFVEIAKMLGVSGESVVRMRFNRAMPRLMRAMKQLRDGCVERFLGQD